MLFCFTKNIYMEINENEVQEVDNRDLIVAHLKEIERPLAWLSEKAEIPYATVYSCFTQKLFKVSDDNLKKINDVLNTNF